MLDQVVPAEWMLIGFIVVLLIWAVPWAVRSLRNYRSPVTQWAARVVAKRQDTRNDGEGSTTTTYFVTLEDRNGRRTEFSLTGKQFGLLTIGDHGMAQTQGTWFLAFERQR